MQRWARHPIVLRSSVAAGYAQLDPRAWQALAAAPIEGIAIDLTRGAIPAPAAGLAEKVLVGGVVDGRNIWRGDLANAWDTLGLLRAARCRRDRRGHLDLTPARAPRCRG